MATSTQDPASDAILARGEKLSQRAQQVRAKFRPGGIGSDTVWALGIEVLNLAASVLSFALLGTGLGPKGYGDYVAIFAITGIFGTLSNSGMALAMMQHARREGEDLAMVSSSCLSLALVSGAALSIVALPVVLGVVDSVSLLTAACFVVGEIMIAPIAVVASELLLNRRGFGAFSRMRMIPLAARMILLVALFWADHLDLAVLGPASLLLVAVVGAVQLGWAGRSTGVTIRLTGFERRHFTTASLFAVGLTALSVQNDGDKAVMAASGTGAEAGLYAAAYKIVQFGLVPMNSLMSSSHQRFLEHDDEAHGQHTKRTLRYTLVALGYGTVFGIGTFIAAPWLTLLLGDQYSHAANTIRLLAPLVLARSVSVFAMNGLLGLGRTGVRTTLLIGSATLSMGLYVALIPSMGSTGAVIGTLVGEGLVAVVAWALLSHYQRDHDRRVDLRRLEQP